MGGQQLYFIKVLMGFNFYFSTSQNAVPQKGSEVNLTLGGIDLNNSGRLFSFLNNL